MAWSSSAIMREWPIQMFQVSGTGYTGLDSDSVKGALFNNTITPDKDAALASAGYGVGQWAPANEVTDATNWVAGGRVLASKTFTTPSTGVAQFSAANLAGGGNVTLANVHGVLVYDDSITAGSVADQAVCYNYLGGAQAVTNGQFTVVWSPTNGICRFTV